VNTLVRLESVSSVPITSAFDKGVGFFQSLLRQYLIAKEKSYTNDGECDVNLGA